MGLLGNPVEPGFGRAFRYPARPEDGKESASRALTLRGFLFYDLASDTLRRNGSVVLATTRLCRVFCSDCVHRSTRCLTWSYCKPSVSGADGLALTLDGITRAHCDAGRIRMAAEGEACNGALSVTAGNGQECRPASMHRVLWRSGLCFGGSRYRRMCVPERPRGATVCPPKSRRTLVRLKPLTLRPQLRPARQQLSVVFDKCL